MKHPMVRLAFAVTAANAASVIGIFIGVVAGVVIWNESGGLTVVIGEFVGYLFYLGAGILAMRNLATDNTRRYATIGLAVAPLVAAVLWFVIGAWIPGIEWSQVFLPYVFVLGAAMLANRRSGPWAD